MGESLPGFSAGAASARGAPVGRQPAAAMAAPERRNARRLEDDGKFFMPEILRDSFRNRLLLHLVFKRVSRPSVKSRCGVVFLKRWVVCGVGPVGNDEVRAIGFLSKTCR